MTYRRYLLKQFAVLIGMVLFAPIGVIVAGVVSWIQIADSLFQNNISDYLWHEKQRRAAVARGVPEPKQQRKDAA